MDKQVIDTVRTWIGEEGMSNNISEIQKRARLAEINKEISADVAYSLIMETPEVVDAFKTAMEEPQAGLSVCRVHNRLQNIDEYVPNATSKKQAITMVMQRVKSRLRPGGMGFNTILSQMLTSPDEYADWVAPNKPKEVHSDYVKKVKKNKYIVFNNMGEPVGEGKTKAEALKKKATVLTSGSALIDPQGNVTEIFSHEEWMEEKGIDNEGFKKLLDEGWIRVSDWGGAGAGVMGFQLGRMTSLRIQRMEDILKDNRVAEVTIDSTDGVRTLKYVDIMKYGLANAWEMKELEAKTKGNVKIAKRCNVGDVVGDPEWPEKLVKIIEKGDTRIEIWEARGSQGKPVYITKVWGVGYIEPDDICPDLDSLQESIERANQMVKTAEVDGPQSPMFEYDNNALEQGTAGSLGMFQKNIEYLPQDQKQWWFDYLEKMRKQYPGKTDIILPETDEGGVSAPMANINISFYKKAAWVNKQGDYKILGLYAIDKNDKLYATREAGQAHVKWFSDEGISFENIRNRGGVTLKYVEEDNKVKLTYNIIASLDPSDPYKTTPLSPDEVGQIALQFGIDPSRLDDTGKGIPFELPKKEGMKLFKKAESKEELKQQVEFLVDKVYMDALTGMNTRRYLEDSIDEIMRKYKWIMIIDIDKFKDINDTYGHPEGDHILQETAKMIYDSVKDTPVIRWGGEEFVIFEKDDTQEIAHNTAERVRSIIEDATKKDQVPVTVSIGVASLGKDLMESFKRADKNLYAAKEAGRNKVSVEGFDTSDVKSIPKTAQVETDKIDDMIFNSGLEEILGAEDCAVFAIALNKALGYKGELIGFYNREKPDNIEYVVLKVGNSLYDMHGQLFYDVMSSEEFMMEPVRQEDAVEFFPGSDTIEDIYMQLLGGQGVDDVEFEQSKYYMDEYEKSMESYDKSSKEYESITGKPYVYTPPADVQMVLSELWPEYATEMAPVLEKYGADPGIFNDIVIWKKFSYKPLYAEMDYGTISLYPIFFTLSSIKQQAYLLHELTHYVQEKMGIDWDRDQVDAMNKVQQDYIDHKISAAEYYEEYYKQPYEVGAYKAQIDFLRSKGVEDKEIYEELSGALGGEQAKAFLDRLMKSAVRIINMSKAGGIA